MGPNLRGVTPIYFFPRSVVINYGYIVKSIPLEDVMMHVFNGFGSIDVNENTRIKELLDLENNIPDEDRKRELKQLILCKLVSKIQVINTKEDLLNELKRRPHLNDIPLTVKEYFNLMD